MTRAHAWIERPFEPSAAAPLAAAVSEKFKLSAAQAGTAAKILAKRGIDAASFPTFVDPSFKSLPPPSSLPGVDEAARAIAAAAAGRKKIVVFGDYDADGVSASAILARTLAALGADAAVFIPRRKGEGYGLTAGSISRMFGEHPGVETVVTVDNGITACEEIAYLRSRNVETVVTDHHLPGDVLPGADVLVNPMVRCDPDGAYRNLCGAGVAFVLSWRICEIAGEYGLPPAPANLSASLAVMAGVATVADMVPLKGANRALVSRALALFRRHAPAGIAELHLKAARRATERMDAADFGFVIAPRLNACGRMGDAMEAYSLLMCDDREEARLAAVRVDNTNVLRQSAERDMAAAALERAGDSFSAPAFAVVGDESPSDGSPPWHAGVAGIVAARLSEKLSVPCAVAVRAADGRIQGSVRAPAGYNVHAALSASAAALERFGGHEGAGGFTVKPGMFEEFSALFSAACEGQRALAETLFDCEARDLSVFDLSWTAFQQALEPFGEENPEPLFALRRISLADAVPMGHDGKHLSVRFRAEGGVKSYRGVWWNHGAEAEALRAASLGRFDILATPYLSEYDPLAPSVEWKIASIVPTP